jgi:hypothetical protein
VCLVGCRAIPAQDHALRLTQLYECRVAASPGHGLRPELQSAGDFDGDGHDDLLVMLWTHRNASAAWLGDCWNAEVEVRSGTDGSALWRWPEPSNHACALAAARAGDVDRDGREDLILTVVSTDHETIPRVGLVAGGDGRVIRAFEADIENRLWFGSDGLPRCFGSVLGSLGDVDSDDIPDYFVGAPEQSAGDRAPGNAGQTTLLGSPYRAQLGNGLLDVYSGRSGIRLWRQSRIHFDNGFASCATAIADINGDDVRDLVVGASPSEIVQMTEDIRGNVADEGGIYTISGRDGVVLAHRGGRSPSDGLGRTALAVGDVDGDGSSDAVVGASQFDESAQEFLLIRLSDGEILRTFDQGQLGSKQCWGTFRGAGDLDGDGRPELVEFADPLISKLLCRPEVHVVDPRTGESLITLSGDAEVRFGIAAGCAGDANGDDRDDLAVCEGVIDEEGRLVTLVRVYQVTK